MLFFFVVFVFHIRHTLGSAKLEMRSKFVLLPVPWRGGATLMRGRKGKKKHSVSLTVTICSDWLPAAPPGERYADEAGGRPRGVNSCRGGWGEGGGLS